MSNLFEFIQEMFGRKKQTNQQEVRKQEDPIESKVRTPYTDKKVIEIPLDDYENPVSYSVYFTNGHLSKIEPYPKGGYYENRDIANNADFIISDGIGYDLTSVKSILSIVIPSYSYSTEGSIGTTGYLEYVLRMHSGLCWGAGEFDLAIACLEKATQLMKYSTMGWPIKDFYRIVNWLNDLGKFKSANSWREWIAENVPGARSTISSSIEDQIAEATKKSFRTRISSCKELGTDLMEIGDTGACCSKCAM